MWMILSSYTWVFFLSILVEKWRPLRHRYTNVIDCKNRQEKRVKITIIMEKNEYSILDFNPHWFEWVDSDKNVENITVKAVVNWRLRE